MKIPLLLIVIVFQLILAIICGLKYYIECDIVFILLLFFNLFFAIDNIIFYKNYTNENI